MNDNYNPPKGKFDSVYFSGIELMDSEDSLTSEVPYQELLAENKLLREQLGKAVSSAEFFCKYADCKTDKWVCGCSFCKDVDASKNLRSARECLEKLKGRTAMSDKPIMTKNEFITRRTKIIGDMLENPNDIGIFPTGKAFALLDDLFDELTINIKTESERGASWAQIELRGEQR